MNIKIKKIIVSIFVVVGLLTEIHGSENHEYSIYIGDEQNTCHYTPLINMETENNSTPLYMREQKPVLNTKCNLVSFCGSMTIITGFGGVGYILYLIYLNYQLQHLSIGK